MGHRTLLASCPYRKAKFTEKEEMKKKENDKQINRTYAGIAKVAIEEVQPKQINITRNTDLKMTALILEAHIAALSGKRKFGDILSESMKLNFQIDVKFPDRNSQEIFNIYKNRTENDITDSDISIEENPAKTVQPTNKEQIPSTSSFNQPQAKRKQSQLTPTENEDQKKSQKTKRTESFSNSKKNSQTNSAPTSPSKASSPSKNSSKGKIRERIEYYIYKSESDNISYKPLPTIEGIAQLLYKQKIKLGLP